MGPSVQPSGASQGLLPSLVGGLIHSVHPAGQSGLAHTARGGRPRKQVQCFKCCCLPQAGSPNQHTAGCAAPLPRQPTPAAHHLRPPQRGARRAASVSHRAAGGERLPPPTPPAARLVRACWTWLVDQQHPRCQLWELTPRQFRNPPLYPHTYPAPTQPYGRAMHRAMMCAPVMALTAITLLLARRLRRGRSGCGPARARRVMRPDPLLSHTADDISIISWNLLADYYVSPRWAVLRAAALGGAHCMACC